MIELNQLLIDTDTDREVFYKYYQVKTNSDMTISQLDDAIAKLKEKVGN